MSGSTPGGVVAGRWLDLPHPVVVADQAGTVRALSESARALLPDAAQGTRMQDVAPAWLWQAHQQFADPDVDSTDVPTPAGGERRYGAHPMTLPTGEVAWWLIDDTEQVLHDSQQALTEERERSATLDEAATTLMASLNVDRCMETTAQLAARHLAATAVVVAPAGGHRLSVVYSSSDSAGNLTVDADPAAVPGLGEALRGFPPVPSRWIDPAAVPDWLVPEGFEGPVGSVVITPLPGYGTAAGALILLRGVAQSCFDDVEERFARAIASRAGAALSAARLYAQQSAISDVLMRSLLPPQLHRLDGIGLAGGYRAAEDHEMVGDFYDVHPAVTVGGETLVLLGDVCGKGVEAAALTGKVRNTLQALAPLAVDHERVLGLLNEALLTPEDTRFVTLVLASITPRDGQVVMRLTCAGHLPPLIVRNDGRVEEADTHGMFVGAVPDIHSSTFETTLAPGEICLLYTDGVTEARGGPMGTELFGEERLAAALAECAGMPPEAVVERIMMLTSQWVGSRGHDDTAVVAIAAPRRTHLSAVGGHTAGRYVA